MLEGVVQGVGFRPFAKRLADRFELSGITFNTASGLIIEIDSHDEKNVLSYISALHHEAPPAALIERCLVEKISREAFFEGFQILASATRDNTFTLISPDLATCAQCIEEISDPTDRRFEYPFTNCTNCGPRYSITLLTPYDRSNTTMRRFALCPDCATEYANPSNRRFHAEPVACPVCGPRLSIPLKDAIAALEAGQILTLKGIGGFQLACDTFRADAVEALRVQKRRSRKPFGVMMRDLRTVERYCLLDDDERRLLADAAAPLVLLVMKDAGLFPAGVAPGLKHIGVMLPYSPLHHLLFKGRVECMVMTSGNISEEPIVISNDEAVEKLSPLADKMLMHDRDIFMRVDDSVARLFEGMPRVLRRARGYAPSAIALAGEVPEVLATGAELKNTFCVTKGRYAIPSQHIGDLENVETLDFFEETLRNLQSVYQSRPQLIAHDLHPDYLSTRWAIARPEAKIAVQHHHAHIASCMAENGLNEKVIGVAFDGTGFGSDGEIWGGEFLLCDFHGYKRYAHLRYVALPGGDRAAREGWRMAAAHLYDAIGPDLRTLDLACWRHVPPAAWKVVERMLERPAIRTSSCGRLFDAVSAICGIGLENSYEGEAAMLLEGAVQEESDEIYRIELDTSADPWTIDTRSMLRQIASDIATGRAPGKVASTFHRSLAEMIGDVCIKISADSGIQKVCLSGGTFQNFTLLAQAVALLRGRSFKVFLHSKVPPNDGGISLGQAAIGAASITV